MRENNRKRVLVISRKASGETLNDGVENGFVDKSFVKNANVRFLQCFSTSKFVFDENKCVLRRRRGNELIEVMNGSFGNKYKLNIVVLKNLSEILHGKQMQIGARSANNVIFRRLHIVDNGNNFPNVVKNLRINRARNFIKSRQIFHLSQPIRPKKNLV